MGVMSTEPGGPRDESRRRAGPAVGTGLLVVRGEVDLVTADRLAKQLQTAAGEDRSGDVRVDLGGVTFIDVVATRVVVAAATRLWPDRRLVVLRPPSLLERILDAGWGHVPGLHLEHGGER